MISNPYIEAYSNKEVSFKYRGRYYNFSLSQELFSSADIDGGSRFLLKVFSDYLDKRFAKTISSGPFSVLDAGSGTGVLGICAAGAISQAFQARDIHVRAQDRDELARVFTKHNAERNGFPENVLEACTEPLLSGPAGQKWDLILTNIPAKAGAPVLEDFVRRSASLLKKDGLVFLVAVNTLAHFFRESIAEAKAPLASEETGKEHTVFVYGGIDETGSPILFDEGFPQNYPFYIRNRDSYKIENISYRLDTVYGAPGFDNPGGSTEAAAKLALKIDLASRPIPAGAKLLVHGDNQGHFALWLAHYLNGDSSILLSGRNILALGAARQNLSASFPGKNIAVIPAADIFPSENIRKDKKFNLIAVFPESLADIEKTWENLGYFSAPGCIIIVGMASAGAERFNNKKNPAFTRLGDVKRHGFRALAYVMRQE